jgi:hypothetical protein
MNIPDPEKVSVSISKQLYDQLVKMMEDSNGEFQDIGKLIEFILEQHLTYAKKDQPSALTSEEEELIKKKLNSLGYI